MSPVYVLYYHLQDTLKKRMQVQVLQNTLMGVGSVPQYDNVWHCVVKTYKGTKVLSSNMYLSRILCYSYALLILASIWQRFSPTECQL